VGGTEAKLTATKTEKGRGKRRVFNKLFPTTEAMKYLNAETNKGGRNARKTALRHQPQKDKHDEPGQAKNPSPSSKAAARQKQESDVHKTKKNFLFTIYSG